MVSKLDILPKTIDSPIVEDGLVALSTLQDRSMSSGLYLVVGGTAVQSYLPSNLRRPTSDIDLSVVRPLNYAEFKEFSTPVQDYLRDNGYEVDTFKRSQHFKLMVYGKGTTPDVLSIEFSRRNSKKFESIRSRLERELDNGRKKRSSTNSVSYKVAAPEDIVVPKLIRGIGTLRRHKNIQEEVSNIFAFGNSVDLGRILHHIIGERATASISGDSSLFEKVRLKSDLYDSICLSETVGFNDSYSAGVACDWKKMKDQSPERDILSLLARFHLPETVDELGPIALLNSH